MQAKLDSRIELITLDLPGHGESTLEAETKMTPEYLGNLVVQTLKNNGLEKYHLISNSLGGWISLEMAAKYPDQILSVTALAPAGLWHRPRTSRGLLLSFNRYLAIIAGNHIDKLLKYKLLRKIGFGAISPKWQSLSFETCSDAAKSVKSAKGYFKILDATLGRRFDEKISERVPVTIIFGDSDNVIPAKDCQERSLAPAHARWITLENTGHAPMWDNVEAVLENLYKTVNLN